MVAKYMPRIIEALKKFKHVVIDEGKQLVIDMLGDIIKIVIKGGFGYELEEAQPNGFKEIWGKVVAAVKSYTGPLKEDLKKLVIKYKPRILDELQKFKKVVIEEGKGLVVEMWEKVKAKVAKMKEVVRKIPMKKLEKFKPQIMDAVQHLKDVVIACGKDVVITVKDGIIKVIVDGGVVEETPEYIY